MHVERLDRAARIIQSREHNPAIRRRDHRLSVQPDGDRVRWTDRIVIDAGWRTPVAATSTPPRNRNSPPFDACLRLRHLAVSFRFTDLVLYSMLAFMVTTL